MTEQCTHKDLKYGYVNVAGNTVYTCKSCGRMIIKKPGDDRLFALNENAQLIEL